MFSPRGIALFAAAAMAVLVLEHFVHNERKNKKRRKGVTSQIRKDVERVVHHVGGIPGGLINMKTLCFINSTIQRLRVSLERHISSPVPISTTSLTEALYRLCECINVRSKESHVYSSAEVSGSIFQGAKIIEGIQQDAHEMLLLLLARLDEERCAHEEQGSRQGLRHCLPTHTPTRVITHSYGNEGAQTYANIVQSGTKITQLSHVRVMGWPTVHAWTPSRLLNHRSPMQGFVTSRLHCQTCNGHFEYRVETFFDLSVSLPTNSSKVHVSDTVRSYFKPQCITDYWCWRCSAISALKTTRNTLLSETQRSYLSAAVRSGCGSDTSEVASIIERLPKLKATVVKSISIGRMPRVLCLHINRLQYHAGLGRIYKSDSVIHFDRCLYLSTEFGRHARPRPKQNQYNVHCHSTATSVASPPTTKYELVAVMVHRGNEGGGHFYTYRRLLHRRSGVDDTTTFTYPSVIPQVETQSPLCNKREYIGALESTTTIAHKLTTNPLPEVSACECGPTVDNGAMEELWYRISDESVVPVEFSDVLADPAYMLFYEQIPFCSYCCSGSQLS
eukprot:CFRG2693T1